MSHSYSHSHSTYHPTEDFAPVLCALQRSHAPELCLELLAVRLHERRAPSPLCALLALLPLAFLIVIAVGVCLGLPIRGPADSRLGGVHDEDEESLLMGLTTTGQSKDDEQQGGAEQSMYGQSPPPPPPLPSGCSSVHAV